MSYQAPENRFDSMRYRKCGQSGIRMSALSFGYWNNFGDRDSYANCRALTLRAFDLGITHFDLADGYGPPAGAAEEIFGKIIQNDLAPYREQFLVTTKAGFPYDNSPYGQGGSRKHLLESLDRSLKTMHLDHVDIFYHHRMDPDTPLEESMDALAYAVKSGRTMYVGVSNYDAEHTQQAADILREKHGIHLFIQQPQYNMFVRDPETNGVFDVVQKNGMACIPYLALAQGLLSGKYNQGVPEGSRASKPMTYMSTIQADTLPQDKIQKVIALGEIAAQRGQTMAQMALSWILRLPVVSSVLIGASKVSQIEENVKALDGPDFTQEELDRIDQILSR